MTDDDRHVTKFKSYMFKTDNQLGPIVEPQNSVQCYAPGWMEWACGGIETCIHVAETTHVKLSCSPDALPQHY